MKKFLIKSILFSVIFFGTGFLIYLAVNARNGLQVSPGDKLLASKWNELVAKIDAINSIPSGSVVAFNALSCPIGWIAANGSNSTPDLRGEFIRGLDGGRGIDSGRTLGSSQESTSLNTVGRYNSDGYIFNTIYNADGYYDATLASKGLVGHAHIIDLSTQSSDLNGMLRHWYYIRPRNVALLYCVKQ